MNSFHQLSISFLVTYALLVAFTLPKLVKSRCYPDKKQHCDEVGARHGQWNTSIRIFLFTRKNHKEPELLHMCNGRLPKNTNFNPQNRLIVFIPGYLFGICEVETIGEIKDELLVKGDFNVMVIDHEYEIGIDYVDAVERLPQIANYTTKVLQNIQDVTGLKNDNVYLLTHSLGSQIAASVSSKFKVHRITGLDPAGIEFPEDMPASLRLDQSDADIVDVIHCNGGKGLPNFGIAYPAGDADFFINGGSVQPSCLTYVWEELKQFNVFVAIGALSMPGACAHIQCLLYYKLTINNPHGNYTAWSCNNYKDFKKGKCTGRGEKPVIMGFDFEESFTPEHRKKPFPRKYYLQTTKNGLFVVKNPLNVSR